MHVDWKMTSLLIRVMGNGATTNLLLEILDKTWGIIRNKYAYVITESPLLNYTSYHCFASQQLEDPFMHHEYKRKHSFCAFLPYTECGQ